MNFFFLNNNESIVKEYYPNKVFNLGLPGTGVHLSYAILNYFLEKTPVPEEPRFHEIQILSSKKFNLVLSLLQKNFKNHKITYQNFEIKGTLFIIEEKNTLETIYIKLDINSQFISQIFSTHYSPKRKIVKYFKKLNYNFLFEIRDPANAIISFSNKYSWGNPELLLNNKFYFSEICRVVSDYFYQIAKFSKFGDIIFYEDYKSNYLTNFKKINKKTTYKITEDDVSLLKNNYLFKNLKIDKKHYWNPTLDKKNIYLSNRHMDIISKTNLYRFNNIIKSENYNIDFIDPKSKSQMFEKDIEDRRKIFFKLMFDFKVDISSFPFIQIDKYNYCYFSNSNLIDKSFMTSLIPELRHILNSG